MFNFTALMWVAYDGFIEIVDHLLLHEGIDINIKNILISKSFMIFKNYFFFNNIFLLIYGIEFDCLNSTALIFAAGFGHYEVVERLLSQPGIDINCVNILKLKLSL